VGILNIAAIEANFRELQATFPEINQSLLEPRDPLDDDVVSNLLAGYAMVDRLVDENIDILAMGNLHYWLKLNATVLCGDDPNVMARHSRLVTATEARFYNQPDGGIRDIMDWYARNEGKSVWRRAAGVFIRILSEPQLFIEGNHRTGAMIMSYLLAREGRPPFVVTNKNAHAFFNPASVFKKSNKRNLSMRIKMPGLTSAFADYLQKQASRKYLGAKGSLRPPPVETPDEEQDLPDRDISRR
jgi:prophage maintenance system killer protein